MGQHHLYGSTAHSAPPPETSTGASDGQAVMLRPDVHLPDWTVVRTDAARHALGATFEAFDMARKWSAMGETEDRVWRTVLDLYARAGKALTLPELAAAVGVAPDAAAACLQRLRARDLVVLDTKGHIVGAYPFTNDATEHRVDFGSTTVMAMCVIDALGVGTMLGIDTVIRARCRSYDYDYDIEIATRDRGQALALVSPDSAIVWSGVHYADACATTSLCTVQAFFYSDQHLHAWRRNDQPGVHGFRLSVDEALQVGWVVFVPMLQPGAVAPDATSSSTTARR